MMPVSKKFAVLFSILGVAAGTAGTVALQTHAAAPTTAATTATQSANGQHKFTPPAAAGTVTAVSGNTITVTDKKSGTSYTVDASGATIQKFSAPQSGTTTHTRPTPTTISVSGISVGDNVMVQGTVSGTNVTATSIMDGMMFGRGGFGGPGNRGTMGTVSAVNGNTITLTGKNGTTYTINASSAQVKKVSDSSVSAIAVGDQLMVQGTTSGNSVTASQIVDGVLGQKPTASTAAQQ